MISQMCEENRGAPLMSMWAAPWIVWREYQNRVAGAWLASLAYGSPFSFADACTEATDEARPEDGASHEPAPPDPESDAAVLLGALERVDLRPETARVNEAEREVKEVRPGAPSQAQQASNGRPRTPRRPAQNSSEVERTASGILDGLRDRTYSVKRAAVSAMTTNKRFRTEKSIPLLERIADSATIRQRNPELCTDAKKVLHQIREDSAKQSAPASRRRSGAKKPARSRRRVAS